MVRGAGGVLVPHLILNKYCQLFEVPKEIVLKSPVPGPRAKRSMAQLLLKLPEKRKLMKMFLVFDLM